MFLNTKIDLDIIPNSLADNEDHHTSPVSYMQLHMRIRSKWGL